MAILAILVVITAFYYVWEFYRFIARYPRGPLPLPVIGNYLQLDPQRLGHNFRELAREYGSVFTVYLPFPMVILSDYEAVKEAFITKGDEFSGRPFLPFNKDLQFCPNPGVVNANGDSWRENRRNAVSIFRDFGMGKGIMEEKVKLSIEEYLRFLDQLDDTKHVDMRFPIQLVVGNIITEMMFGYRYKYDDCEELINYLDAFNKLISKQSTSLLTYLPLKFKWLRSVPFISDMLFGKYATDSHVIKDFIREHVEKCMESYSPDAQADCFVHAYSQKIPSNEYLTDSQLMATCSDFFLAGQETTATTLRWAMLLLAANQDVQDRLRCEIHCVVGKDRLPAMADKQYMPYTTATVHEIQRRANILQMNVMRRTLVDTEIMGHKIPKNTMVNGDIHRIMAEDPIFERPEEFLPERYLSADGKTLNKDAVERTIPFSIGKRQCAGEALARVELFLVLASTVQHYRISPSSEGPVDLSPMPSVIQFPKKQPLRIEKLISDQTHYSHSAA